MKNLIKFFVDIFEPHAPLESSKETIDGLQKEVIGGDLRCIQNSKKTSLVLHIAKAVFALLTNYICLVSVIALVLFLMCNGLSVERMSVTSVRLLTILCISMPIVIIAISTTEKILLKKYAEENSASFFQKYLILFAIGTIMTLFFYKMVSCITHEYISWKLLILLGLLSSLVMTIGLAERRYLRLDRLIFMSSEVVRFSARCLVTTVLLIAFILIVPPIASRIKTYNMYWDGGHGVPCAFAYPVDEHTLLYVINEDGLDSMEYIEQLDRMPRTVLKSFADDGWTLIIDSDYLAEYSWQTNGKRYGPLYYGIMDQNEKSITVSTYGSMQEMIFRYCFFEHSNEYF